MKKLLLTIFTTTLSFIIFLSFPQPTPAAVGVCCKNNNACDTGETCTGSPTFGDNNCEGVSANGTGTGIFKFPNTCITAGTRNVCVPDGNTCFLGDTPCCTGVCNITGNSVSGTCGSTTSNPTGTSNTTGNTASQTLKGTQPQGNCASGHVDTALGCIPTDTSKFLATFFPWAIGIAGGVAFILAAFGVILRIISAGNPEQLQKANELIIAAVTGLLVVIFSVTLLKIISVDTLQLPIFNDPTAGQTVGGGGM